MDAKRHRWMTSSHVFAGLVRMIGRARRRSRDRLALAMLDDRELRDMGVARSTLAYELNKPFWRD